MRSASNCLPALPSPPLASSLVKCERFHQDGVSSLLAKPRRPAAFITGSRPRRRQQELQSTSRHCGRGMQANLRGISGHRVSITPGRCIRISSRRDTSTSPVATKPSDRVWGFGLISREAGAASRVPINECRGSPSRTSVMTPNSRLQAGKESQQHAFANHVIAANALYSSPGQPTEL